MRHLDGKVLDAIEEHPSFVCNQLALRLGVIATGLTAIVSYNYPPPYNICLAVSTLALGVHFWLVGRFLLPRVRNCRQLDYVVFSYTVPITLLQWAVIWFYPEQEVAIATGCMLVLLGLLFTSLAWVIPMATVTATGWLYWKSYLGAVPNIHEYVQLLIIAPVIAAVARLATSRSIVSLQLAKLREQDSVKELRGTVNKLRDETELRKNSEAQLLRAQKHESLGLMAGGIAHDFNNMLTVINSHTEIIRLGTNDAKLQGHTQDISRAVNQAAAICRQMLIYAGKSSSQMTDVDLAAIVADMQPLLQASFSRRVAVEVAATVHVAPIVGNTTQIQQLLLNLVTNGAEAIQGLGTVRIAIYRVTMDESGFDGESVASASALPGNYYAISVIDSGSGMGAETKQQMFDPYFTTKGSGHGFGLSTVLGIAKLHNAPITVQSKSGQGTTVTILFPEASASRPAALPKPPETPSVNCPIGKKAVLLVEDDDTVRNSVAQMLTAHGWTVVKADSGKTAIRLVNQSQSFSVLVIDFNMPHMNGQETLNELRRSGCTSPAILFSGTINPLAEEIPDFVGFLPKPLQWKDLESMLTGVMRSA